MKPRDIAIDYLEGTTKNVYFEFSDEPNLQDAVLKLTIKKNLATGEVLLVKDIDLNLSPDLATGKFTFRFLPNEFENWTAKTYRYELKVEQGRDVCIPILGEFRLFPSVS